MKAFGETDDGTRVTKINKKASIAYGKKHDDWATKGGALANTIEHELIHQKHNKMHEDTVRKETPKELAKMSKRQKKKLYDLVK